MSHEQDSNAKRPATAREDARLMVELFASPDTPVDVLARVEDALFTLAEEVCVNLSHPKLVRRAYLLMIRSMREYEETGGGAAAVRRMHEAQDTLARVLRDLRRGGIAAKPARR